MWIKPGVLCICDGWRLVLVRQLDDDGISEDFIEVQWKDIHFWVYRERLRPLTAADLENIPPTSSPIPEKVSAFYPDTPLGHPHSLSQSGSIQE